MNLFRAFMELDELNEGLSRREMISRLKALGKNYNFDRFSDKQLFGMLRDTEAKKEREKTPKAKHDLDLDFEPIKTFNTCDFCNTCLTDTGQCPVCDLGEEALKEDLQYCWFGYYLDKDGNKKLIYATQDSTSRDADEASEILEDMIPEPYTKFVFRGTITDHQAERAGYNLVEGIFDSKPSRWVSTSGQPVKLNQNNSSTANKIPSPTTPAATSKYIVRIVSHGGRLRALATDGTNPAAFVAFPNNLRKFEGQKYEVDQLIWNGKNYRVAGNITEV